MHMQREDESVVVGIAKFVQMNFGWKKNAKILPVYMEIENNPATRGGCF